MKQLPLNFEEKKEKRIYNWILIVVLAFMIALFLTGTIFADSIMIHSFEGCSLGNLGDCDWNYDYVDYQFQVIESGYAGRGITSYLVDATNPEQNYIVNTTTTDGTQSFYFKASSSGATAWQYGYFRIGASTPAKEQAIQLKFECISNDCTANGFGVYYLTSTSSYQLIEGAEIIMDTWIPISISWNTVLNEQSFKIASLDWTEPQPIYNNNEGGFDRIEIFGTYGDEFVIYFDSLSEEFSEEVICSEQDNWYDCYYSNFPETNNCEWITATTTPYCTDPVSNECGLAPNNIYCLSESACENVSPSGDFYNEWFCSGFGIWNCECITYKDIDGGQWQVDDINASSTIDIIFGESSIEQLAGTKIPFAYFFALKDAIQYLKESATTSDLETIYFHIPFSSYNSTSTGSTTITTAIDMPVFSQEQLFQFIPETYWTIVKSFINMGISITLFFKLRNSLKTLTHISI